MYIRLIDFKTSEPHYRGANQKFIEQVLFDQHRCEQGEIQNSINVHKNVHVHVEYRAKKVRVAQLRLCYMYNCTYMYM